MDVTYRRGRPASRLEQTLTRLVNTRARAEPASNYRADLMREVAFDLTALYAAGSVEGPHRRYQG